MFKLLFSLLALLPFICGCQWKPSREYHSFYSHLHFPFHHNYVMKETDYFLVILVDAPHLDYTSNAKLIQTIIKHPNGSDRRDFGHAWIYLKGIINGQHVYVEGGHSGELGVVQPTYFDGIMNNIEYGESNPKCLGAKKYEPNPIKYLWEPLQDGFFEEGPGMHSPTFAAKVDITEEEFVAILHLLQNRYDYSQYSLTTHQCCTLVAQAARIAGLQLDYNQTISIDPFIKFPKEVLPLWKDAAYSIFTFGCPDVLEKSLIYSVIEGKTEYALPWYLKKAMQFQD